jgi:hypothetical protein
VESYGAVLSVTVQQRGVEETHLIRLAALEFGGSFRAT